MGIEALGGMIKADGSASLLVYVVVGDPVKGLVGIGRGRGDQAGLAIEAAYYEGESTYHQQVESGSQH